MTRVPGRPAETTMLASMAILGGSPAAVRPTAVVGTIVPSRCKGLVPCASFKVTINFLNFAHSRVRLIVTSELQLIHGFSTVARKKNK